MNATATTPEASPSEFSHLELLHLFPHFHTLGGAETVLRHHFRHDPEFGVASDFVVSNEPVSASESRVHCFGLEPGDTLRNIERKCGEVCRRFPARVAIYHLLWGVPFFSPCDGAARRMLLIHGDYSWLWGSLAKEHRALDGILCINAEMKRKIHATLPGFPAERVFQVNIPIAPPSMGRVRPGFARPVRLGYSGRMLVQAKRIDRIPAFCRALDALGVDYQLELLGDGPERTLLERDPASSKWLFHGLKSGEAYWDILRQWDFILFFSDREGTPVSLLEALSQGVLPLFPQIRTGGDPYVEALAPWLLYPPADLAAASAALQKTLAMPEAEIQALQAKSVELVAEQTVPNYLRSVYRACQRILTLPRISSSERSKLRKYFGFLTLSQADRLAQWKKRLRGQSLDRSEQLPPSAATQAPAP